MKDPQMTKLDMPCSDDENLSSLMRERDSEKSDEVAVVKKKTEVKKMDFNLDPADGDKKFQLELIKLMAERAISKPIQKRSSYEFKFASSTEKIEMKVRSMAINLP